MATCLKPAGRWPSAFGVQYTYALPNCTDPARLVSNVSTVAWVDVVNNFLDVTATGQVTPVCPNQQSLALPFNFTASGPANVTVNVPGNSANCSASLTTFGECSMFNK